MFDRITKIYHEFPRLFWIVVAISFIDRIGNTLLFPFFALYITQKFSVGMAQATRIEADFTGTDCQQATFVGQLVLTKN